MLCAMSPRRPEPTPAQRALRAGLRLLGVLLLAVTSLGASCGQSALSILPGVVNDPSNRTLRREIFGYAVSELCSELQSRSIPLKLRDPDPSIGRFFPSACNVQQMPSENLFVQLLGHGYAWTNVTGRMGFEASAAVEYDQDFLMDGSTMYVYFRQVQTQSRHFQVRMVERGEGSAAGVAGLLGGSLQAVTQQVGERILDQQLTRGFTVIRESDGTVSFTLGVLDKGQSPLVPFQRGDSDWLLLANDRTELHLEQRDYVGPFTVEDEDDALWLTALVEGAPAVDVLVVPKAVGDTWIQAYETQPAPPPLVGAALVDEVVPVGTTVPGRPPVSWRRALVVPPGSYWVVFDNTSSAGKTTPTPGQLDDRAALVSYAVQLGDRP